MLAVILCFAPQLYLNYRQFGGIFTFPYIMHPNRSAEGFAWDCLAENVPYLIQPEESGWEWSLDTAAASYLCSSLQWLLLSIWDCFHRQVLFFRCSPDLAEEPSLLLIFYWDWRWVFIGIKISQQSECRENKDNGDMWMTIEELKDSGAIYFENHRRYATVW